MINLTAGNGGLSSGRFGRASGFTLVELIAVVAIIAILVSLLSSALNRTKEKALRITCINNMKQLQNAWLLYVQENDSYFPLNQGVPIPPDYPRIPMAFKPSSDSWVTGSPLVDLTTSSIKKGSLYPYVGSAEVYRCPLDSSTVLNHPDVPRNRSYAISAYLGGEEDNPRVKYRETELINPRPANTFVFIEEHESSIWAANFMVLPPERGALGSSALSWVSTPSDRHYRGCNLSFADGHIEYWRWYSPKHTGDYKLASTGREMRDIRRLQACVPGD